MTYSFYFKIILLLFFFSLLINPVNGYMINYTYDKIPMFKLNDISLIETVEGSYITPEDLKIGGKIADYTDENIEFDYVAFDMIIFQIYSHSALIQ